LKKLENTGSSTDLGHRPFYDSIRQTRKALQSPACLGVCHLVIIVVRFGNTVTLYYPPPSQDGGLEYPRAFYKPSLPRSPQHSKLLSIMIFLGKDILGRRAF
jgi:hypothetical protein